MRIAKVVVETFAPDGGLVLVEGSNLNPEEVVRKYLRQGYGDDRYVIFDIEALKRAFPRRWRKIVRIVKDEVSLEYSTTKVLLVTAQNGSVLLVSYDSPYVPHITYDEEEGAEPLEPVEDVLRALRSAGIPATTKSIWLGRRQLGGTLFRGAGPEFKPPSWRRY